MVLVAAVSLAIWILSLSHKGLDFTDEGFYLQSILHPRATWAAATQFGWVYHPLYLAAGGEIGTLRGLNVLLSLGLGAWVAVSVLPPGNGLGPLRWACVLALGSTILMVHSLWLITPNYNTLLLQAFCITFVGLRFSTFRGHRDVLAAVLIGAGGTLALLAKPSAAIGLGAISGCLLLIQHGRKSWIPIAFCLLAALVGTTLSSTLITGSPFGLPVKLDAAAEAIALLDPRYGVESVLKWEPFPIAWGGWATFGSAVLCGSISTFCGVRKHWSTAWASLLITSAFSIALMGVLHLGWSSPPLAFASPTFFAGLAFGSAGVLFALQRRLLPTLKNLSITTLTSLLPIAYAIGTNNSLWGVARYASVFWLAAVCYLGLHTPLQRSPYMAILPLTSAALFAVAVALLGASQSPYRQTVPIKQQTSRAEVGNSNLLLSPGNADYFRTIAELSRSSGFRPGTPVLDLTGQSPTTVYAMGGKPIGLAWIPGGYPGSEALTAWLLARTECAELAHAWIIFEPQGPRSINPTVLGTRGLSLGGHYEAAFSIVAPAGSGGFSVEREQQVLRPASPQKVVAVCQHSAHSGPELG